MVTIEENYAGRWRPSRVISSTSRSRKTRATLRLDGQYETGAVLADLAGLAYVTRGQDYHLLDRDEVQARLHLPPDQQLTHPESGIARALYDCPAVSISGHNPPCRIIVATHPATEKKSRVGRTRSGVVYELFLTALRKARFHGGGCGGAVPASRRI